jgi:hypothetical protein
MYGDEYQGLGEYDLGALRQVCLITLDVVDAHERLSNLYDQYGEGDDELLRMMMNLHAKLELCSKQEIMSTFRRISEIRPLTRNK